MTSARVTVEFESGHIEMCVSDDHPTLSVCEQVAALAESVATRGPATWTATPYEEAG